MLPKYYWISLKNVFLPKGFLLVTRVITFTSCGLEKIKYLPKSEVFGSMFDKTELYDCGNVLIQDYKPEGRL